MLTDRLIESLTSRQLSPIVIDRVMATPIERSLDGTSMPYLMIRRDPADERVSLLTHDPESFDPSEFMAIDLRSLLKT